MPICEVNHKQDLDLSFSFLNFAGKLTTVRECSWSVGGGDSALLKFNFFVTATDQQVAPLLGIVPLPPFLLFFSVVTLVYTYTHIQLHIHMYTHIHMNTCTCTHASI